MAAPKRTTCEREADLVIIAQMYLQRATQRTIAQKLGLSQPVIMRDIATLIARWQEDARSHIDLHLARELAAIDELERHYWAGFARSLKHRERTTNGKVSSGEAKPKVTYQTVKEQRDGQPAWLDGVAKCQERRCKLLGLDRPVMVDVTVRLREAATEMGLDPDLAVERALAIIREAREESRA